jgi:magnesium chelatase family protein
MFAGPGGALSPRISGPLLDRIDIHIEVPAVEYKEIAAKEPGRSSAEMRQDVEQARRLQQTRFGKKAKIACNARMSSKLIKQHCELDETSMELLRMAMSDLNLSARAYDRILKVSRTIADMAGVEKIAVEHLSEAIQYRTLDRNLWV